MSILLWADMKKKEVFFGKEFDFFIIFLSLQCKFMYETYGKPCMGGLFLLLFTLNTPFIYLAISLSELGRGMNLASMRIRELFLLFFPRVVCSFLFSFRPFEVYGSLLQESMYVEGWWWLILDAYQISLFTFFKTFKTIIPFSSVFFKVRWVDELSITLNVHHLFKSDTISFKNSVKEFVWTTFLPYLFRLWHWFKRVPSELLNFNTTLSFSCVPFSFTVFNHHFDHVLT